MPSAPVFTVVCAAYNAAATIARAVRSCLAQTYPPHEVIVVDDGSTDGTAAVVEALADARIRLLRLEANSGPSAARNAGLDAAIGGTFIALIDADDWWHADKLAAAAQTLEHRPSALLFHRYDVAGGDAPLHSIEPVRWPLWKLLMRNSITPSCAVFRGDGSFRFDEGLWRMEDWEFFLRYTERHSAYFLDLPLTHAGRQPMSAGGLSGARWRMRLSEMRVYTKWAFARPWYLPLLPLFILWSTGKGLAKAIVGARS